MRLLFSAEVVDIYLFSLAFNTCITTDSYSFSIQNSWFRNGKLLVSQWKTIGFSPWNYWFRNGELLVCQLKVVFLVIVIEDGRLAPATSAANGSDLVAVLRGDGGGAVAELEVLGLGEVLYQSLADGFGLALWDVLVEVEHAACHLDLGIGTVVSAGASDDIFAVGVDDGGIERVIGCPLTDKPVQALVLAGAGSGVAQQIVPRSLTEQ